MTGSEILSPQDQAWLREERTAAEPVIDPGVLARLSRLFRDKSTALELLERLVKVLGERDGDPEAVGQAVALVNRVVESYEDRLRIGLVGVARARVERVARISRFVDTVEGELFRKTRVENSSTKDLINLLNVAQKVMVTDLEFIDRVAEMRLRVSSGEELLKMMAQVNAGGEVLEIDGEPVQLLPETRERLRRIIGKLISLEEPGGSRSAGPGKTD